MTRRSLSLRCRAVVATCLLSLAVPARATTIHIVNIDGVNEGFNDPTPAAPVGGNPGTTVGQQRLNVFARAAQIWSTVVPSTITIRVEASFDPLSCSPTTAILGSAGAIQAALNFPNAPVPATLYPIALANKLANTDLVVGSNDIEATFSTSLNGSSGCLGGARWYYGYDGNEGTDIDLLPVVLHEIGHGLGFATFATLNDGFFPNNLPDIYARGIRDLGSGLRWDQMTPAQRVASATSGNVVWDGQYTALASPLVLAPRTIVVVSSPPALAGTLAAGAASFGGALGFGGVTGSVVLANDGVAPTSDGCTPLVNAPQVLGRIALVDRGACNLNVKAQAAQAAGAIGVLIANNTSGPLAPGGTDPSITIPVVGITQADGNAIRNQLVNGVVVTLKLDPNQDAGADPQGRPFLYAPGSLVLGSSISHFDIAALPNLLMEPAINHDLLAGEVDLTEFLLRDIGWFQGATDAPAVRLATRIVGNTPNPFNPGTRVHFDLETTSPVQLSVYDLGGRLVKQLARGTMTAGTHAVRWDGTDAAGRPVATGVYVARLAAGGSSDSRRMVLVK